MSLVETRRHQMFPVLDMAQIETAKRFASGAARSFAPGEIIYDIGERSTPAWLVLEGSIEVVARDGLNHEVAITTHRSARSAARSASLPDAPRWRPVAPARRVAKRCPSMPPICARSWSAPRNSARWSCAPSSCAASGSFRRAARARCWSAGRARRTSCGCRAFSPATAIPTRCWTLRPMGKVAPSWSALASSRRSCR